MQKAIVSNIDEKFLECGTEFSDRFVYSNYFIPLSVTFADDKTQILPAYKKNSLREYFMIHRWVDPLDIVSGLPDLGLDELLKKNEITLSARDPDLVHKRDTESHVVGQPGTDLIMKDHVKTIVNDMTDLTEIIGGKLAESDRGFVSVMKRKIDEIRVSVERAPMMVSSSAQSAMVMVSPYDSPTQKIKALEALGMLRQQEIEFFLNLLKSDVGYLFLDRTRVRPKGFAIGEHLYALSLAPGEEIILEQKTFSKRQMTFEEQNEQEKQFDLELSSTLSTEIQEGFERQKNRTDSWGLTWNFGVQYSSPKTDYGQVNANFDIGETRNVTEANQETRTRSVKDSQTASSKVASKYRTLHKTTFKISTEEGFESTSKRIIKNPNRFTPINLHYFKILQRLEMTQERYGVRLCWAPCVKDPAFAFFDQIKKGREAIEQKAKDSLPQKPPEPQPPPPPGPENKPPEEKKWKWSPEIEANQWSGAIYVAMRHTYQLKVPVDNGFFWDGDLEVIKQSLKVRTEGPLDVKDVTKGPISNPWMEDANLIVPVHIGAPDGFSGRHIYIQIGAQLIKTQTVTEQTNEDAKYKAELAAYPAQLNDWNAKVAQALEQARKDADAWEQGMLKSVNPITEMISQIIQNPKLFPPSVRDECWEIDLWQKLFDWERASYVVYPSWWSDLPMRDPTKEPTHFFNASWAKLYLPVRVGMERLALRWIFGKVVGTSLAKEIEEQFEQIEKDLSKYRKDYFGGPTETIELDKECKDFDEKFYCQARWTELMPTDGTHIEVIQSMTSAADQFSKNEVDDANKLRNAVIESEQQDAELKKKALDQMTAAAKTDVNITIDGGLSGG